MSTMQKPRFDVYSSPGQLESPQLTEQQEYYKDTSIVVNGKTKDTEKQVIVRANSIRITFGPSIREGELYTDRDVGQFSIANPPPAKHPSGRLDDPLSMVSKVNPPIVFELRDNRGALLDRVEVPSVLFEKLPRNRDGLTVWYEQLKLTLARQSKPGSLDRAIVTFAIWTTVPAAPPHLQPKALFSMECSVCGDVARQSCPCGDAAYCSVGCQREDWQDGEHAVSCKAHI